MTYVGKPQPVVVWKRKHRSIEGRAEAWARRRKIALGYEEREKLEILFYGAEAKWQHAFATLRAAGDSRGVVAIRQARYQLRRMDHDLREAYRHLLDADCRLQSLLAAERSLS